VTKKQIRKLADEIVGLERIHRDPNSSSEEVSRAEKRIIQISNMLMCLPNGDGLEIMNEIDSIINKKLEKD
jgi:hypothetical protein